MNIKKYLPSTTEMVKITVVFVVLSVTGVGVYLVSKANVLLKRS